MSRTNQIFLQLFTYCFLIGCTSALIGKRVRAANYQLDFVVSIANRSESKDIYKYHLCTGTLIRPRSVLTAAHCLVARTRDDIQIIGGSLNLKKGTIHYPDSWITFDQWNRNPNWEYHKNDIAVIILQGQGITNVPQVTFSLGFYMNSEDIGETTIVGWGETEKHNKITFLRMAHLTPISNKECSERGTILKDKKFLVPPNYFCSRAEPYVLSSCGDGGAPILDKHDKLIGINVGVCPNLEGYAYDTDFLHHAQLNSHLHLHYYMDFIQSVWK